jgi:putative tryptophan/tyrosine transport system substrate-binding protein
VLPLRARGLTTAVAPRPSSIPIVTIVNPDPIGLGLAQSLARPGGNVTGLTDMDFGIYGKRIEFLKQAVPNLERAGVLNSRGKPLYRRDSQWAHHVEADARSVGVELEFAEAARMISMTRSPH